MPLNSNDFADDGDNILFQYIKTCQWQRAEDCLSAQPQLAQQTDTYGNTPLHAALGYRAPLSLLQKLLQTHPDACRVNGTDDWLPLHVAAMWGAPTEIVEAIIRLYPKALDDTGEQGIKGRTPRHFAARFPENKALLERPTEEWIQLIAEETKQVQ